MARRPTESGGEPPSRPRGMHGQMLRRLCAAALLAICPIGVATAALQTPAPGEPEYTPTVLVVYASFKGFSPYEQFHEQFKASLERDVSGHVDVQAEFIDVMISRDEQYEAALMEYIRQKYIGNRIEVIVGVGARAVHLAARIRAVLYPSAGVSYGFVDQKVASTIEIGPNSTGVTGSLDFTQTTELALKLVPDVKHVALVAGASELERAWYDRVVAEARVADADVELIPLFGLPKDELMRRIATLPDHTVVVWGSYFREPGGSAFAPREVLSEARKVTSSPIFGVFDYDLGAGVVGGRFVDISRQGEEAGRLVARVVNGERADAIPPVHVADNPMVVDWREFQRWGLEARRLPSDAVIRYREPTAWETYKWYIVGGAAVFVLQALLIAGLFVQHSHRRGAQRALAERLRFERLIADLSARFVDLPVEQIDTALAEGLRDIRAAFSADRVSLVELGDELADSKVVHSVADHGIEPLPVAVDLDELQPVVDYVSDGGSLQYSRTDEIPESLVSIRAAVARHGVRSGIAVPVHTGGTAIGTLLVAALRESRPWPEDGAARLRPVADIFANALVRKRGAAALRRSQALSDAVLESITAQVCVLDHQGRIIAVNDAWKRASDTPGAHIPCLLVGERCGAESGDLAPCAMADTTRIRRSIRAVLDGTQETFTAEYRVAAPTSDGWYLLTVERLRVAGGGAVISHQNITARKRAELDAEQRRQELAHVSRVSTMGELAASLAHELNQPLTGVLTNAQAAVRFLALEPPNVTEVRDILTDIIEDDKRAGEVIRRLRSMLQTGAVEPADLDVNEVVTEVVMLLGSDAILRNVVIETEFASDIPSIHGDRIQLQQVILNLVVNAMDAMKETEAPGRRVTIQTMASDASTVLVSVSDRGHGIEHDKLGRIFQPFYTTKAEGLGMGLSIARTIVEAHGGVLWATNNPDRGASFICRLPAHEASEESYHTQSATS
jgi:signal transduction histidine kinase/ABC-type uncharacterized transport system substrate-binding protein